MNDDQKITTEDKELADMIAGLNSGAASSTATPQPPFMPNPPVSSAVKPSGSTVQPVAPPLAPAVPSKPLSPPVPIVAKPVGSDLALDSVKRDALNELRPLVDKLNLPAEEKFDTLLLLIRSTDDKSLVASAHEAAKNITDETRRAAALLDIIKEIDFFENPA